MRRSAVLLLAFVLAASTAAPVQAQTGNACPPGQVPHYVAGFAALKGAVGSPMGDPVTCEFADPNGTGDVHQRTTTGLAFWRKSTNTPTFTNGTEHWALNGTLVLYWTGTSIDPPQAAPADRLFRADPREATLHLSDLGRGWVLRSEDTEGLSSGFYSAQYTLGVAPTYTVDELMISSAFVCPTVSLAETIFTSNVTSPLDGWLPTYTPALGDDAVAFIRTSNGAHHLIVRVQNVVLDLWGGSTIDIPVRYMQILIPRVRARVI
jgi:hypothetical protein